MIWLEGRPDGGSNAPILDRALEQFLRQQELADYQQHKEEHESASSRGLEGADSTVGWFATLSWIRDAPASSLAAKVAWGALRLAPGSFGRFGAADPRSYGAPGGGLS